MLNTLKAPCINEYWLPSVVVTLGACQSHRYATGTARTLQSSVIIVYLWLFPSSEPMWSIEARNAAIAQTYFTAAINRVGTVSVFI